MFGWSHFPFVEQWSWCSLFRSLILLIVVHIRLIVRYGALHHTRMVMVVESVGVHDDQEDEEIGKERFHCRVRLCQTQALPDVLIMLIVAMDDC